MFGYKIIKKSALKEYEIDILSLKEKVNILENNLKIERNNERNLYGDNCKLRLEIDVLKKEISELKGETEEKKETEKPVKETPKKRVTRRKKSETKKAGE